MALRWLRWFAVGAVLMHGAPACVGGTDETGLNPQPLPPGDDGDGKDSADEPVGVGGSSGGTTSDPERQGEAEDAGADGDATGGDR